MTTTDTALHHSSEKLRCARCQRSGAATWEQSDPARPLTPKRARNRYRKLVGLTAGFKSIDDGGKDGPVIMCAACGARVTSV